jgi:hypothetical protein
MTAEANVAEGTEGAVEGGRRFGFIRLIRTSKVALATPYRLGCAASTYSGVIAELERREGFCPHVENPLRPIHRFGMTGSELEAVLDRWYEETEVRLGNQNGSWMARVPPTRGRLVSAVASYPVPIADMTDADVELCEVYLGLTEAFLRRRYGDRLVAGHEHADETYRHAHYQLFDPDPLVELHPGYRAKAAAAERTSLGKAGNVAYREAMAAFQRSFAAEVSLPCGFAHRGPRRRRLPQDAVSAIRRERRLAEEAGRVAAPVLVENVDLRRRVEELTALAEKQSADRERAEGALRLQTRRAEFLSEDVEHMASAGDEVLRLRDEDRRRREDAENALEFARKRNAYELERLREAERRALVAEGSNVGLLERVRSLADDLEARAAENARLEAELTRAKRAAERLIGELDEARGEARRLAAEVRRLGGTAGAGGSGGTGGADGGKDRSAPFATRDPRAKGAAVARFRESLRRGEERSRFS